MPDGASPTQQWMDKYLMQLPVETVKGLLGIGPTDESDVSKSIGQRSVGTNANLLMQAIGAGLPLLKAGLPFAALMGDKPIYHGTPKTFEKFNPAFYDTGDVLGWMTHGTPNEKYAERYAMGSKSTGVGSNKLKPNIIPMVPEAQNVLDLVNPKPDDLSQMLASVTPENRKYLINRFKYVKGLVDSGETGATRARSMLDFQHYPDTVEVDPKELAIRYLADKVRLSPDEFNKTPFDAIKYKDMFNESFAIPSKTSIKTPAGVPLNDPPRSLKVIKSNEPSSGQLEVDPKRWENVPLSLPEVPHAEIFKYNSSGPLTDIQRYGIVNQLYSKFGYEIPNDVKETLKGLGVYWDSLLGNK